MGSFESSISLVHTPDIIHKKKLLTIAANATRLAVSSTISAFLEVRIWLIPTPAILKLT